ncbi:hypothetical protein V0R50_09145 [Pseudomonas sp. 148P]|uniref:Uncharacterized protein n=1 Tax=Pseudomonas ulcerans TaxID=3115852 RepID=A0ABU7HPG0_9PSED|nr:MULTISPECIES: hypothetical protein [unclassified Pseudomonas]MEE1920606.1 hypothetical protein [Pseudomonas sp. 147P]MEE1933388.1 hypothetical protein [Pseudomonas sp. 148P]
MSRPSNTEPLVLAPAVVEALLDDIEGGQPNLLPFEDTLAPLRVEIPMWGNSDPTADAPETLLLLWNGNEVGKRIWTTPVQPGELFLDIASEHLAEGVQSLEYWVKIYNGESAYGQPLPITIDKTAPVLGADQGALLFRQEVVDHGVTVKYLEQNGDEVQAEIPTYREARAGDVLTWYWDTQPFEFNQVGSRTLGLDDIGQPLYLTFAGAMIRERGDGTRYVHYQVQDRAGTPPAASRPVGLEVCATPIPRELPWLNVIEADGIGEQQVLDPDKAVRSDIQVALDPDTVIHPGEEVWVQWGEPGTFGAFRGRLDTEADPRACWIPKANIAIAIGKTPVLYYEVISAEELLPSTPQSVRVLTFPVGSMPTVQCAGHMGNGTLSLAGVPASGAKLTLQWWKLMSTDQMVRIVVSGISTTSGSISYEALRDHRVTQAELGVGIGANGKVVIAKAFLAQLMLDQAFSVRVYVSFDLGETWPLEVAPNFPTLKPRLVS